MKPTRIQMLSGKEWMSERGYRDRKPFTHIHTYVQFIASHDFGLWEEAILTTVPPPLPTDSLLILTRNNQTVDNQKNTTLITRTKWEQIICEKYPSSWAPTQVTRCCTAISFIWLGLSIQGRSTDHAHPFSATTCFTFIGSVTHISHMGNNHFDHILSCCFFCTWQLHWSRWGLSTLLNSTLTEITMGGPVVI